MKPDREQKVLLEFPVKEISNLIRRGHILSSAIKDAWNIYDEACAIRKEPEENFFNAVENEDFLLVLLELIGAASSQMGDVVRQIQSMLHRMGATGHEGDAL